MKETLRTAIRALLHYSGYQIKTSPQSTTPEMARTESPIFGFAVQGDLISVSEPVILDVGAHIGHLTKLYRQLFPLSSIYSFEPFPQSFEALRNNVKGDPRTFCQEIALSDQKGTALFSVNVNSQTNSLLTTDPRGTSFWGPGLLDTTARVEVPTTTLDIFCRETQIPHIDILKIDVQGAEFSVLTGAADMLANQRISLIYTELIMCPTYHGQRKLHEYLVLLDSLGYEFLDFFNPLRRDKQLIQADVVFLSRSFKNGLANRHAQSAVPADSRSAHL